MQRLKQDLVTVDTCHPLNHFFLTNCDLFIEYNMSAINLRIIHAFIEYGNKLVTRLSVCHV